MKALGDQQFFSRIYLRPFSWSPQILLKSDQQLLLQQTSLGEARKTASQQVTGNQSNNKYFQLEYRSTVFLHNNYKTFSAAQKAAI